MVEVDGRRVEAISEQGLIEAGSEVLVVGARSGRLIVRESADSSARTSSRARRAD